METSPCHAATLATPIEPFEQKAAGTFSVTLHASEIATDAKVLDVALEMSTDVLQHGFAPMRSQQCDTHVEFLQFLAEPFAMSLATHDEPAASATPHKVRNAEEVEGGGSAAALVSALRSSPVTKAEYPRLGGFQY